MTRYIIKSEGNSLCVYCEGKRTIKTVELDVSAPPPVDQELLEKGIRVSSKEDLNQLLEDSCAAKWEDSEAILPFLMAAYPLPTAFRTSRLINSNMDVV